MCVQFADLKMKLEAAEWMCDGARLQAQRAAEQQTEAVKQLNQRNASLEV